MARKDLKQISANSGHLGEVQAPQSTDAVGIWRGAAGAMLVGWTTAAKFLTRAHATQAQAQLGIDATTDMSPVRVREAINAWMTGLVTVSGNVTLNAGTDPDTSHFGKTLRANNAVDPVTITLPDALAATAPRGLFCWIIGDSAVSGSPLNTISITTAVGGQLRSQPGFSSWSASTDPLYLGASNASADESVVAVFLGGSLWRVHGLVREAPEANRELVTVADL